MHAGVFFRDSSCLHEGHKLIKLIHICKTGVAECISQGVLISLEKGCPPVYKFFNVCHNILFLVNFFQEEQPIYDAFSQEEFMSKFIAFLSLEDRKGRDKFNVHRFVLFKVM